MKQIIDQAFIAIDHKRAIISKFSNKQNPYYYTETVKVKHKTKILGVNAEPYYTYHDEIRFNGALLDSHLAESDKSINNYLGQINNEQRTLQQELSTTTYQKDQAQKTVENLKAQNVSYRSQHSQIKQNIVDLNNKLDPYRKKDAELSSDISEVTSQINSLGHIKELTCDPVSETEYVIKSYTNQLRSFLLKQVWGNYDEDSLEMLEAIKKAGFDAHFLDSQGLGLLHLAAARNDIDLVELVLAQDPSAIEDKTLLQYVMHNSNQEFLIKILDYNADFSFAVQFIVEQDDATAYLTLSYLKPELTGDQSLYSLLAQDRLAIGKILIQEGLDCDKALHTALEQKNISVITKLRELQPEAFIHTKVNKQLLSNLLTESGCSEIAELLTKESMVDNSVSSANLFGGNQGLPGADLFDVDAIGRELNSGFDDI